MSIRALSETRSERRGGGRGGRRERLLGALLVVVSLLVVFVVVEVAARTYSWSQGKGFWSRPRAFVSPFFVTYDWPPPIAAGDRGMFRGEREVSRAKPSGGLRVVALGGSTTVNARNEEGLTYPNELESALRARFEGRTVEVLNSGGDAFSTAHTLTNLSLRVVDFDPDVVIVYHAINDLSVVQFGDAVASDYANKYLDDAFLAYEHRGGVGGTVFRMSRAAQLLKWRLRVLRQALETSSRRGSMPDAEVARAADLFERNLRSIVAVGREHGIEVVLATQAHREGDDGESQLMRRFNDRTRALADRARVVDVARAMGGRAELFLDPVHLTSDGVRLLAATLAPEVERALRASEALPSSDGAALPDSTDEASPG